MLDGQYEMSMENEESRKQFQTATGREVLPTTEADVSSNNRRILLEQYILAIHQHKKDWDRFSDLEDYYQAVECKKQVEVESDEDGDDE